ncbi:MAG: sulfotransferase domain-containing protein [Bacteroidota bacterium]
MSNLAEKRNKLVSFVKYKVNHLSNKLFTNGHQPQPVISVVASAHKVGSTWLVKMIRDLYIFAHPTVPEPYRPEPQHTKLFDLQSDIALGFMNQGVAEHTLFKSHSQPPAWEPPAHVKLITIFRDPRDMVVSNIFYLANLDPKYGGWEGLAEKEPRDRIPVYLNRAVFDLELYERWNKYPFALKLTYEQLKEDAISGMQEVVNFLEIEVPQSRIEAAVENNSFKKLSAGRKAGEANDKSFFRKGISGDWLNYFDQEMVEIFKTTHGGRWNQLLVDLGYEENLDWQLTDYQVNA